MKIKLFFAIRSARRKLCSFDWERFLLWLAWAVCFVYATWSSMKVGWGTTLAILAVSTIAFARGVGHALRRKGARDLVLSESGWSGKSPDVGAEVFRALAATTICQAVTIERCRVVARVALPRGVSEKDGPEWFDDVAAKLREIVLRIESAGAIVERYPPRGNLPS